MLHIKADMHLLPDDMAVDRELSNSDCAQGISDLFDRLELKWVGIRALSHRAVVQTNPARQGFDVIPGL